MFERYYYQQKRLARVLILFHEDKDCVLEITHGRSNDGLFGVALRKDVQVGVDNIGVNTKNVPLVFIHLVTLWIQYNSVTFGQGRGKEERKDSVHCELQAEGQDKRS